MLLDQLPKTIDPRKLARQGSQFEGSLPLSKFERLVVSLASNQGEVFTSLSFFMSSDNRVILQGHIQANLKMTCQRCLEVTEICVASDLNLMGVLTDEQIRLLPEHYEPLMLQDEPMPLIPLIEEELLLSLPIVAYHPPESCPVQQSFTTASVEETSYLSGQIENDNNRINPFSVLAGLKTGLTKPN